MMSIAVSCPGCSRRLTCPPSAAGRRVKCPKCQVLMEIPAETVSEFEEVEEEFEVVDEPSKPESKPAPRPVNRRRQDDARANDDDDMIRCPKCGEGNDASARRCGDCDARLGDDAAPKKKKKKKPVAAESHGFWSFEKGLLSGGVLGGVLAMIGAVVWFVLGLQADRIFFYPPILFIVGLVAAIKGMAGQND